LAADCFRGSRRFRHSGGFCGACGSGPCKADARLIAEAPPLRPERPRFEHARREDRREHRGDDDLGSPVVGFGDDIPAFMRIVTRTRRPPAATMPEVGEADFEA